VVLVSRQLAVVVNAASSSSSLLCFSLLVCSSVFFHLLSSLYFSLSFTLFYFFLFLFCSLCFLLLLPFLFLTLSLPMFSLPYIPPLPVFLLPICSVPPLTFIARGCRRFLVTAGGHHTGEGCQPRDVPPD